MYCSKCVFECVAIITDHGYTRAVGTTQSAAGAPDVHSTLGAQSASRCALGVAMMETGDEWGLLIGVFDEYKFSLGAREGCSVRCSSTILQLHRCRS